MHGLRLVSVASPDLINEIALETKECEMYAAALELAMEGSLIKKQLAEVLQAQLTQCIDSLSRLEEVAASPPADAPGGDTLEST